LLEPERTGETVAEVCARRGISQASYDRYRRRYLEEGLSGLEPRSRRRRSSPGRIDPGVEVEIVTLRKRHARWGARRIHAELRRGGIEPPAVATIHRALRRNHLVAPQPPRRAKARKRFERELCNDLWQIDGTQLKLAGGERVWVVDCLDDDARFLLAALACTSPTGEAAWACFVAASAASGLPRQLLSDNHLSFTGRRYGIEVAFQRKPAEVGVEPINAAPAHPQTLGKLERFHRTLKEWHSEEGPALDLEQLQLLRDRFRSRYNEERPHQGIGNLTPVERYWPGPAPAARLRELERDEHEPPLYPPHSLTRKVWDNGVVGYQRLAINIGRRYRGATIRLVEVGQLIHVHLGEELIRVAALDRTRRYQRRGQRRRP
jgi:transposase InsO family protein